MCKKREKRESEGVGVSVSFSEEKAVYNILVLRSLEKYSNLVKKKKKIPIYQKLSHNCSSLPVPFSVLKEAPAFSLGTWPLRTQIFSASLGAGFG